MLERGRVIVGLLLALLAWSGGCASVGARGSTAKSALPAESGDVQRASYEDASYSREIEDSEPETWWERLMSPTSWSKSATNSYKTITGQQPKPDLARQLYAEAEDKYRRATAGPEEQRAELLMQAAAQYYEAAQRWPDSALEQDGLYMAGESYFFADAYVKANTMYEKLIKKYPGTKHMDTIDVRRYAVSQYWLELTRKNPESWYLVNYTDKRKPWRDTHGHALRVYDKIRVDDPSGKLADDATMAAANAHFVQKDFFKADEYYGDLRKSFPASEHQFQAHFLGLKTKILCYQGSDYSGDALDEAEKLIKQIRKQFPQEASVEKEYLDRAMAEVRYKKAEREWDTAQYFVNRGEYGSARLYQNTIVEKFGDTPFSKRAQDQLREQASYPAMPPKRLQWLVNAFPREEPAKPWFFSDAPAAKK